MLEEAQEDVLTGVHLLEVRDQLGRQLPADPGQPGERRVPDRVDD
jgi:hypothetical protein